MALFLDKNVQEKVATPLTRMDSNADNWEEQILSEAYRQLPYLSDYDVTVILPEGKVRPEQGYAVGYIAVKNITDRTPGDELVTQSVNHIRIPIVIKKFGMAPLDLFMREGKTYPLTEARFRQTMFRPEGFDVAQNAPPQKYMGNDLSPPFGGYLGGSINTSQVLNKYSAPMLQTLAPFMPPTVVEKVADIVSTDPDMVRVLRSSEEFAGAMGYIAGSAKLEKVSAAQVWDSVSRRVKPTTVQMTKLASGNVRVKWANSDAFLPQEEEMLPEEAAAISGGELPEEVGDTSTVSTLEPEAPVVDEEAECIDQFGEWRVATVDGRQLVGWVFPELLQFHPVHGESLPLSLFTNGSEHAVQPGICGVRVGQGTSLPHGPVRKYGCLYCITGGTAKATVPFRVLGERALGEVVYYQVTTDMGEYVEFTFVPGIQCITPMGQQGQYGVPESYRFLPIEGAFTQLVADPAMFNKEAEAQSSWATGEVIGDGTEYTVRGMVFDKLASPLRDFVSRADAEFLLVAAGVPPDEAKEKLARADQEGLANLANLRPVVTLAEHHAGLTKQAAAVIEEVPKPVLLVKEAAGVALAEVSARRLTKQAETPGSGDASTVDAVLSLGFLTPETVSVFLSYIPYLEDCVNRLSDLLLATRAGMGILNENSVRTALFALEETINGLKLLAQS